MWFPGLRTSRGLQVCPVVAPPPARLSRRDAPGSLRGRCPRDPRVASHGRMVGGGWPRARLRHWFFRLRSRLASGRCLAASVCPMPSGPARWFTGLSAPPPGFPVWGRSVAGGDASVCCGGLPIVSVTPTVGSSRCGWAGGAGGVAASPVGRAVSRVSPSDTGVRPGWFTRSADRGVSARTVACARS